MLRKKMSTRISLTESIVINTGPELIFDYISNVSNDPYWRPEVEKMEMQGETKLGAMIVEYIRIYRFFRIITPTQVLVLERPHTFVVETPPDYPAWVQCIRKVKALGPGTSEFSVKLSFSLDNIKQISPIVPPGGIVRLWYKPRMKRYMRNIKRILEGKGNKV
jgi:hypothetical protein